MEKERILKAYNEYIQTDIHRNCEKYRKLSDGKSADVFFADVRARVNLEYMGIVDNKGYMQLFLELLIFFLNHLFPYCNIYSTLPYSQKKFS